jgi:hypothetical protein
MKHLSYPEPSFSLKVLGIILTVLLSCLLALVWADPVLADGGGWPTATLTPTQVPPTPAPPSPTPLLTAIPTSPHLSFPATPTFTPVVPAMAELAAPQLQGQRANADAGLRLTWMTLLPFVVVFAGLGAAGFLWLRSRQNP